MKKYIKYIFIFIFSFVCMSFLLTSFDMDTIWNYGFSYAISIGEIPYKDFNMVLTPLYSFLMSIPLLISKNIIMFYIANSLLITGIFYLLFKLIGKRAWIFLILLLFPVPAIIEPSYNTFLIFLVILLIYLEKNNSNDYLIGLIIGLSILTKQSVGPFLLIPTIVYYRKDIKKILKRLVGLIIPCIIFLIYLLVTKSLNSFIDLCILGLFDFNNSNGFKLNITILIGILLLIVSLILFIKNKKDIKYLYILMFYSIVIPLFDYPHLEFFFFVLSIVLVDKIKEYKTLFINSILFTTSFASIVFIYTNENTKIIYPNKYNNFNYRLLNNKHNENEVRDSVIKYIRDNKDKDIIIIGSDAYFYKITCNMKIDYFDLNNYGNHGYNGTEKMKKKIDNLKKNTIIIIDRKHTLRKQKEREQYNVEIAKYAMKKGVFKENRTAYSVYEIK